VNGFEFSGPSRIVFGNGVGLESLKEIASWSERILLVTGSDVQRAGWLLEGLDALGATIAIHSQYGEPTVEDCQETVRIARAFGAGAVVGLGGGSAIDLAKATAALAPHTDDPYDHLEVVGKGLPLPGPGLPIAAIPTTSGTGAEATRNAVVAADDVKVSLRGPQLMPRLAVVDPYLTIGLPREQTGYTGLDALTQLVEPFTSRFSNPISDGFCREGIARSVRSLPVALADGMDIEARSDLALASLLSGLALANSRLGAVHGLAAPVGGLIAAPHGAVCARLLPICWKANVKALTRENHPGLDRYREVSRLLTGQNSATLDDGLAKIQELSELVQAPGFAHWGLAEQDIPGLCEKAAKASSMKGNPVDLTRQELSEILHEAL